MKDVIKVGVIGAGRIGRIHAANLAARVPGAEVAAISDPRLERAQAVAKELGISKAVSDHRGILDDKAITAVAICSPADTHAGFIKEAAAAGKHIFCEKPVDLDAGVVRAAIGAAKKAGVKLQIGFNRRYDPDFKRVRELVAGGALGAVHTVTITSRDPEPPPAEYVKVSGGIFLDMTIHDFDMARFIAGEEVETVFASGAALVDPGLAELGDVDTAALTLSYRSGALCMIHNSRRAVYGYDQRLEVFGSGGLACAGNKEPVGAELWDAEGRRRGKIHNFFLERYREAYILEMRDFVDCLRTGREPAVSGEDGLQALLLGLAAKQSMVEQRPVAVTEAELCRKQPFTRAAN